MKKKLTQILLKWRNRQAAERGKSPSDFVDQLIQEVRDETGN